MRVLGLLTQVLGLLPRGQQMQKKPGKEIRLQLWPRSLGDLLEFPSSLLMMLVKNIVTSAVSSLKLANPSDMYIGNTRDMLS
ncbi:hypothetical protein TURU_098395 [Turdus rufiventris]|nr:hypothetical protein TURU_098395 [Turdus rufiventris]